MYKIKVKCLNCDGLGTVAGVECNKCASEGEILLTEDQTRRYEADREYDEKNRSIQSDRQ